MGKKIILSILTAGLLLTSFPSEAAATSQYSFVDVIGGVSESIIAGIQRQQRNIDKENKCIHHYILQK